MTMSTITASDRKLLDLLATDAKLTAAQLAAMLDTTEEAVAARIAELEADGILRGYQAIVDWERIDANKSTALIQLQVIPEPDQGFDKLAHRIMQFDQVEGVYLMSGGYDLTVVVQGESMRDIALFVARRLSTLDGVRATMTHFILSRYKDRNVIYHDDVIRESRSNVFDD